MQLPRFAYHPDPVATGSVVKSELECICCGQTRGYIYAGPTYAKDELEEQICPWCIADGSAHATLDVEFSDAAGIGGYGEWEQIPQAAAEEIAFRTPGFSGWQQEKWWTHCGDGAQFLGKVGFREASGYGLALLEALTNALSFATPAERESYWRILDSEASPTGYAFKCRHCGKLGGYSDSV